MMVCVRALARSFIKDSDSNPFHQDVPGSWCHVVLDFHLETRMSTADTRPSPELWSLCGGQVGPFDTPYDRGYDPATPIMGMCYNEERKQTSPWTAAERGEESGSKVWKCYHQHSISVPETSRLRRSTIVARRRHRSSNGPSRETCKGGAGKG